MEQAFGFGRVLVALRDEAWPFQHQPVAGPGQGNIKQVLCIGLKIRATILNEPPSGLWGCKSWRVDQRS